MLRDRNQAIYICALAVQFIMRYHTFVIAPQKNVQRRLMVRELTENTVNYFEWFFSRNEVYSAPICADEMFNEFMRDWADASEGKSKEYSRATFKKKIRKYCKNMNIICNPENLLVGEDNKRHGCFKLRAWITEEYFVGREWENDDTVAIHILIFRVSRTHVGAYSDVWNAVLKERSVGKLVIFVGPDIAVAVHEPGRHPDLCHIRVLVCLDFLPATLAVSVP